MLKAFVCVAKSLMLPWRGMLYKLEELQSILHPQFVLPRCSEEPSRAGVLLLVEWRVSLDTLR